MRFAMQLSHRLSDCLQRRWLACHLFMISSSSSDSHDIAALVRENALARHRTAIQVES